MGASSGWTLTGGGSLLWAKIKDYAGFTNVQVGGCDPLGVGWRMATQPELSGLFNTASARSAAIKVGWIMDLTLSSTRAPDPTPDWALPATGYVWEVSLSNGGLTPKYEYDAYGAHACVKGQ